MTTNSRQISFYADTLIVETILQDESLIKTAEGGFMTSLIEKVSSYFGSHVDPDNKSASVINMLAPGVITMTFRAMGLGWIGLLLGLAASTFHIDTAGMLSSIYNSVKAALGSGQPITSGHVDQAVEQAVAEHVPPATNEEEANFTKTQSFNHQLKIARKLKLAMIDYSNDPSAFQFSKTAGAYGVSKAHTGGLLAKVLGWVFKIALASAGLLVAGDVVNKLIGRPNALDGTIQHGKPTETPAAPAITTTQTKFKAKPGGDARMPAPWVIPIQSSPSSIESMLVEFAKESYEGLDGHENDITSAPGFQAVRDRILNYNRTSAGYNATYMPNYLTSKKQITDLFIDDVAKAAS